MVEAQRVRSFGLWLAGFAIGVKVILAAFAAAPWHMSEAFLDGSPFTQIICTGSGFLVIDENGETLPQSTTLPLCPLCINATPVVLADDPKLTLSLLIFAVVLAARTGLDRPRRAEPPPSGFSSRAPPRCSP